MNWKKWFDTFLAMGIGVCAAKEKRLTIAECDASMGARGEKNEDAALIWRNADAEPMELTGFHWYGKDKKFCRLPLELDPAITPEVKSLAWNTAGGKLRFRTDSKRVVVRVKLSSNSTMPHMAATGSNGFDLYVGEPGKEVYFNTTKCADEEYDFTLFECESREMHTITINFPLYQGVDSLQIGLDRDAQLLPPEPLKQYVAVYGTSVTQGGCAARPGMAYTNILSRRMQRHFYNYGFSGSGKGEPEMAHLMAQLDPALYLLDFQNNAGKDYLPNLKVFLQILRKAHPETPIVVFSTYFRPRTSEAYYRDMAEKQRAVVEEFIQSGDRNIYSLEGSCAMDPYRYEGTVDGAHPTDLGFMLLANFFQPVLEPLLKDRE